MKIKCIPEDFIVTERNDRRATDGGYCLYQLDKRSIGTLEALQIFQRSRNLATAQIAHGGLKDRHALTSQFVTARNGPRTDFDHELFRLTYLGQTPQSVGADDVVGNYFEIVVRSLSKQHAQDIVDRCEIVAVNGFPNYFDNQRFGSLGDSGEFIAAKWCLKDYERAIWLALAEHNHHDDGFERGQKQILRDQWGQWIECKQQLDRSHRRSIVTYLCDHPDGFRKAFALLNTQLRGLYLSAFQSAVWNRMLALMIQDEFPAAVSNGMTVRIGDADLPFPGAGRMAARSSSLEGESASRGMHSEIPLPSARCKGMTAELQSLCDRSLEFYGMNLSEMKLSFPRDRWFSRGMRSTWMNPGNLTAVEADDERYTGRRKVTLKFDLSRGSYATMLIKSLTGQSDETDSNSAAKEDE